MTTRSNRNDYRRQFAELQREALLAAITQDQRQLRERARTLARHGNDDATIGRELGVGTEVVRRWLSEPVA
jgi:hypothetical protein